MGGLALKHLGVVRKSKDAYFKIAEKILPLLKTIAPSATLVPACADKESFGDMDVLASLSPGAKPPADAIRRLFQPRDIVHNGGVYSFDHENFQIDLILVPPEKFDCALAYFSYNDLGNLIGRTAKNLGLKHGHTGLRLPIHAPGQKIQADTPPRAEITLSTNPEEILAFLDYDFHRFKQGFKTLDEIFAFATTSKFFNPERFKDQNQNYENRRRNRQRPGFQKFAEHLKASGFLDQPPEYIPPPDPREIARHFGKTTDYDKKIEGIKRADRIKKVLNGKTVEKLTGLKNRELGEFIAAFKKANQPECLDKMSVEQIHQLIRDFRAPEPTGSTTC